MDTAMKPEAPSTAAKAPKSKTYVVNRIPPSTAPKNQQSKRRRHSNGSVGEETSSRGSSQKKKAKPAPMDLECVFSKLNPEDPQQRRRMEQRAKAINKGKNTVGYTEYRKKVPMEKRHPRSMKTPMTPDPTLDIPQKRWQGIVRAWRVALHDYDPPNLLATLDAEAGSESTAEDAKPKSSSDAPTPMVLATPVKAKELEKAAAMGLLVDIGEQEQAKLDESSPISVLSAATPPANELGDESDDDLL